MTVDTTLWTLRPSHRDDMDATHGTYGMQLSQPRIESAPRRYASSSSSCNVDVEARGASRTPEGERESEEEAERVNDVDGERRGDDGAVPNRESGV